MKTIGFNEEFKIFIKVDFKQVHDLVERLEDAGFSPAVHDQYGNDDRKVEVIVNPFTSASAHTIMDDCK